MIGTVHYLDLAVAHCEALTEMKWSVLDRLEKLCISIAADFLSWR
jgi:hypothetical protein